ADAASFLPDADPLKAYFADKIANNLAWHDGYAANHTTPLGTFFDHLDNVFNVWSIFRQWQNNYVAWAIDRANQQGFSGGLSLRDELAQFTLKLFTSGPDYPREDGAPYELAVGSVSNNLPIYYTTLGDVYSATNAISGFVPFAGYYGVDA